jgi:hypothetical protein
VCGDSRSLEPAPILLAIVLLIAAAIFGVTAVSIYFIAGINGMIAAMIAIWFALLLLFASLQS